MRNWLIWSVVILAALGTAPSKGAEQPAKVVAGKGLPKELTVDLGGGVKMEFVLIPAGEFLMGDDKGSTNEKPAHKVRIRKPFYLGKYEVTQAQWQAVMGNNPSKIKGAKNPVEGVSWTGCQPFLEKLNANFAEGKGKFDLPTEAQWEYACRAGSKTTYCFGDDQSGLGEYAWYDENSDGKTHPVGEKKPNAWGLYDMHGNVWEWCQDWYDWRYYEKSPTDDPPGPARGTMTRMVGRGGYWLGGAKGCRSANRYALGPAYGIYGTGFRVSLVPAE